MSLASLLLGKAAKASDAALDAIFSRTKVVPPSEKPSVIVEASTSKASVASPKDNNKKVIAPPEHIIQQARLAKKQATAKASSTSSPAKSKKSPSKKQADSTPVVQQQQQQQQQQQPANLQTDKLKEDIDIAQSLVKDTKRKRSRPNKESKARANGENISITPSTEETEIKDGTDAVQEDSIAALADEGDANKAKKRKRKSAAAAGADVTNKKTTTPESTATTASKGKTAKLDVEQEIANDEENDDDNSDENASDDDDDDDESRHLVHETLLNGGSGSAIGSSSSRSRKVQKRQDETPAHKDARTTFIGNVPVACATVKSSRKALIKHLIASLPEEHRSTIRLESIRFRSLQLSAPAFTEDGTRQPAGKLTQNEQGTEGGEDGEPKSEPRSRKRARRWRKEEEEAIASENGIGMASKQPKFLTASQKKKIGFITGDLHEKASTCNAYAVWDVKSVNTPASSTASSNVSTMTPQQMAAVVVRHAKNTVFEGFTLRVDHVRSAPSAGVAVVTEAGAVGGAPDAASSMQSKREYALEQKAKLEEEKRTLYVGSLDFEEKEQAIRELCERLMTEERGQPPVDETSKKSGQWVERVRLVRDHATGLGKGFAYVMFKDRECVDEMLAIDSIRVKLSKRKLRLERCKSTAVKAAAKAAEERTLQREAQNEKKKKERKERTKTTKVKAGPVTPRPDIGESLRTLSKDERKALKSADEERLQRRMEKKQARRDGIKTEKAKEALDRRVRSAASGATGKTRTGPAKEGLKKPRIRSEKAMRNKNKKKVVA